ncbi:hypothetical protein CCR75_006733 [Bremia lactucae]|uniref:WD repeat-containing protein WRAP73 n=1 Tax=Bremia lactucae TaxID=4779 RepID=A0A976FJ12_BRELC|nr:hypothetical protein CCR75_006733 [Bremia lactucae]
MASISSPMLVTHGLVRWSPSSHCIAAANGNSLIIRDARSLQIVQRYFAVGEVQSLAWSADSHLVLTASFKHAVVQLWSVQDSSWTCKISEGVAGLVYTRWTPDARHIVTVSDFQLHATVWSLESPTAHCSIHNPKLAADGLSFTNNGTFLAVVERHGGKDFIGIYSCESWELTVHFVIDSYDCVEVVWSPDGAYVTYTCNFLNVQPATRRSIAVRDTHLEFRVLLYSPDGTQLARYQAYENALGLKSMMWSASGQFLALGSYDEHLRVLSHVTLKPIADFDHEQIATSRLHTSHLAIDFEERYADVDVMDRPRGRRVAVSQRSSSLLSNSLQAASAAAQAAGEKKQCDICFVKREPPFSVRTITCDPLLENQKIGISRIVWSADSAFLASKSDQMPYNVWIWRADTQMLHSVVSLLECVRNMRWDPVSSRLAITSGNGRVYFWANETVSWVDITIDSFQALGIQWAPSGDALVAVGRQQCCRISLPSVRNDI